MDEPLEFVVGSGIDRFVNPPDREDFESLLRAGTGRRRSRLVGAGAGALEVSLSLTTTVGRRQSPESDRDGSSRALRGDEQPRPRRTRQSLEDEFLAMLAHELRTPLGAIANAVRVLELTHADGEPADRAHEVIAQQVGHISQLISDLLDVERVVSGKSV